MLSAENFTQSAKLKHKPEEQDGITWCTNIKKKLSKLLS